MNSYLIRLICPLGLLLRSGLLIAMLLATGWYSLGITAQETQPEIKIGIIGLDTSHVVAFTKLLNDPVAGPPLGRCRVVCAYPQGSPDIESSVSRVPKYTREIQEFGVEIVDSIAALIEKVDAVLLETNDGRPHLEQVIPVLKANKPVFVDKPIAGSLADAIGIFELAKRYDTPVFSSSSLRYSKNAQLARQGQLVGEVHGCATYGPCTFESTHPDLYWYGIHGVEQLFTVMGVGCQSVTRTSSSSTDLVVGVWQDGRIGSYRGIRSGNKSFGGTVYGSDGQMPTGGNEGYAALVNEIATFFHTGEPPVSADETIEIYAFMSAADESKRMGGVPVKIADVIASAKRQLDNK